MTVTDGNGCTAVLDGMTVDEPLELTVDLVSITDVLCNGDANGRVSVTVGGGTLPYSYVWSGAASGSSQDAPDLPAGTYGVTVTDGNGCTAVLDGMTIAEPPLLTCTITPTPISCNGGSDGQATVTATGGNGGYSYKWSNNETAETIINLEAGTYEVTVTDAKNCQSICSVTVTEPEAPLICIAEVESHVSFNGGSDGVATVKAEGGNLEEYTYLWDNGEEGARASNLNAGLHTIEVMDAKGCKSTCSVNVQEPEALVLSIDQNGDQYCSNLGTCVLTAIVTGGVPPYQYLWSTGDTSKVIEEIGIGTYMLTVTDDNNYSVVDTIELIEVEIPLTVSIEGTDLSCVDTDDGVATARIIGGQAPYTIVWDDGRDTETITGLKAGVYRVSITDNAGSQVEGLVSIEAPALLMAAIEVDNGLACSDQNEGLIAIEANGGNPPYRYNWSTGDTSSIIQVFGTGQFSVTVTDRNNCMAIDSLDLTDEDRTLRISIGTPDGEVLSCAQGLLRLEALASNGRTDFNYAWYDTNDLLLSRARIYDAKEPGSYRLEMTTLDGNCGGNAEVTITEVTDVFYLETQVLGAPEIGCGKTSVNIEVVDPVEGAEYTWMQTGKEPFVGPTYTTELAGAIIVTGRIPGLSDCLGVDTINIRDLGGLQVRLRKSSDLDCNQLQVTITAELISGEIEDYIWSRNGIIIDTTMVDSLVVEQPGLYELIAKKGNCESKASIQVNSDNEEISIVQTNKLDCYHQSVELVIEPNWGRNISYEWLLNGQVVSDANRYYLLADRPGKYTARAILDGCVVSSEAIVEPFIPSGEIDIQQSGILDCSTPSIDLVTTTNLEGRLNYQWYFNGTLIPYQNEANLTVSEPGSYRVIASSAICEVENQITVESNSDLVNLTVKASNQLSCENPIATLTATTNPIEGLTYKWYFDGELLPYTTSTIETAFGGPYPYLVIASNETGSCKDSVQIVLPIEEGYPEVFFRIEPFTCENSTAKISVSRVVSNANYGYKWTDQNGNSLGTLSQVTVEEPGMVYCTVFNSDANCSVTFEKFVAPLPKLEAEMVQLRPLNCNAPALLMVEDNLADLAVSYLWSDETGRPLDANGPSIELTQEGIYFVELVSDFVCEPFKSSFQVKGDFSTHTPSIISSGLLACNGGVVELMADVSPFDEQDFAYSWVNDDFQPISERSSLSIRVPGTYFLQVLGPNGCRGITSFEVLAPKAIENVSIQQIGELGCGQDNVMLMLEGMDEDMTYRWIDGFNNIIGDTNPLMVDAPDQYAVEVIDPAGCSTSASIKVDLGGEFNIAFHPIDTTICLESGVRLSAQVETNDATVSWLDANGNTISNTLEAIVFEAGTYFLSVDGQNGCQGLDSITVNEPSFYEEVTIEYQGPSTCKVENGQIVIYPTTGLQYSIDGGINFSPSAFFNELAEGRYEVWVVDLNTPCDTMRQTIDLFSRAFDGIGEISITEPSECSSSDGAISIDIIDEDEEWAFSIDGGRSWTAEPLFKGLPTGDYEVWGQRNGGECEQVLDTITLSGPVEIIVASETLSPECFGWSSGRISINISGGTAPYNVQWSTGEVDQLELNELDPGVYGLSVTDSEGCTVNLEIELSESEHGNLGLALEDAVICKFDVHSVQLPESGWTYTWSGGPEPIIGDAGLFEFSNPGNYILEATDLNSGCIIIDSMQIDAVDELSIGEFLIPSIGEVNSDLVFIEVSRIIPDQLEWILPDAAEIIDQGSNWIKVSFSSLGDYEIGLNLTSGSCGTALTKNISIVEDLGQAGATPTLGYPIQAMNIFPNPTDGAFTLNLELNQRSDFTVALYPMSKSDPIYEKSFTDLRKINEDIQFPANVPNGEYVLYVIIDTFAGAYPVILTR